jgi:acyl-coenzyme A synthetase/AMP-(fatty) acid ligase
MVTAALWPSVDGPDSLAGRAKDLIIRGGRDIDPAAVPRWVERIDAIPLTSIGKPYEVDLRRRAAERTKETTRS